MAYPRRSGSNVRKNHRPKVPRIGNADKSPVRVKRTALRVPTGLSRGGRKVDGRTKRKSEKSEKRASLFPSLVFSPKTKCERHEKSVQISRMGLTDRGMGWEAEGSDPQMTQMDADKKESEESYCKEESPLNPASAT